MVNKTVHGDSYEYNYETQTTSGRDILREEWIFNTSNRTRMRKRGKIHTSVTDILFCTTEALEIKGAANSVCLRRIVVQSTVCGLGVYGCG